MLKRNVPSKKLLLPLALLLGGGASLWLVYGLWGLAPRPCIDLSPAQPSAAVFEIVGTEVATVKEVVLGSPLAQSYWAEQTNHYASGQWSSWATWLDVRPKEPVPRELAIPILLTNGPQPHRGYLFIHSFWKQPHPARVSFLLDYQQARIQVPGGAPTYFYDLPSIAPQAEVGLEFMLPPLSPGFHQLSVLLIMDPLTTTTDLPYRVAQRGALAAYDYDVWVDTPPFQPEVPRFDDQAVGLAAAARTNVVMVMENPRAQVKQPVLSLNVPPNATTCVNLDLLSEWNEELHGAYTGTVPMRLGVFWNDQLTEVLDYGLPPKTSNDYLPLNLRTPAEPGTYQLGLMVFRFPGYSRLKGFGQSTLFAQSVFSQRIVVNVQP